MAPRKIHIASKTYQRNWAVNRRVHCTAVGEIEGQLRNIDKIGYRPRWWGLHPGLAGAVELQLSKVENQATAFLRDPERLWPLDDDQRAFVAVFIALHVVRSPAWRLWHERQVHWRVAAAMRAEPSSAEMQMEVARRLLSDQEVVSATLSQCLKLASLVASMHWSLLRFDGLVLALSDQPVCSVPLAVESGSAPLEAVPEGGFADLLEVRVPVSPSHALILSWHDRPEDGEVLTGSFEQACSLNASTISQADRHWMRHPEGTATRFRPPSYQAIADPIAPQILDAYDVAAVLRSQRRREATAIVTDLIESHDVDRMGWVSLQC